MMTVNDRFRWDNRYLEDQRFRSFEKPRPFLVEHNRLLPRQGLALDVAMGLGGNARWLINQGFRVIGVDISGVAIFLSKKKLPSLMAVQADLTNFVLPENYFDLIVNFFFLERTLWADYQKALKPGGILIIETLTQKMLEINPEIESDYLLKEEELRNAFDTLEIITYQEGWQNLHTRHPRAVAGLVARKPEN